MNGKIDIVIPWVDGSDPDWQREKQRALTEFDAGTGKVNLNNRYNSWDNLHYLFRAIEMYMPWYNRIFLVTCGQVPEWLNTEHPRLRLVKHEDYIPREYLPTFNSNTIEMNYWRIPDLAENFIVFNDDCFPLRPIEEEFFFQNDSVCDEAIETPIVPVPAGDWRIMTRYTRINNLAIINKYFDKREVQAKAMDKWFFEGYGELLERNRSMAMWNTFVGFRDPHLPSAVKKSVFQKLWELEPELLNQASANPFRAYNDISWWVVRYWILCTGEFVPRRTKGKYFDITMENYRQVADVVKNQAELMVGLNEHCTEEEFCIIKEVINGAFQGRLPRKSSYEC